MAPKATTTSESDPAIKALILLMTTADEFKPNMKSAAAELGISQASNVPRKINSMIGPHGYELKAGKVVLKDGGGNVAPTATSSTTKILRENGKKAAAKAKATKSNGTRGQAVKKRKLAETEAEEDDGDEDVKDDATTSEEIKEEAAGNEEAAGDEDAADVDGEEA